MACIRRHSPRRGTPWGWCAVIQRSRVSRVLFAVDPVEVVVDEAIERGRRSADHAPPAVFARHLVGRGDDREGPVGAPVDPRRHRVARCTHERRPREPRSFGCARGGAWAGRHPAARAVARGATRQGRHVRARKLTPRRCSTHSPRPVRGSSAIMRVARGPPPASVPSCRSPARPRRLDPLATSPASTRFASRWCWLAPGALRSSRHCGPRTPTRNRLSTCSSWLRGRAATGTGRVGELPTPVSLREFAALASFGVAVDGRRRPGRRESRRRGPSRCGVWWCRRRLFAPGFGVRI